MTMRMMHTQISVLDGVPLIEKTPWWCHPCAKTCRRFNTCHWLYFIICICWFKESV